MKRCRAPSEGVLPSSDVGMLIEQIYIEIEPELVFEEGKVIKQEPECEEDMPDDCGLSESETDYCSEKVKDNQPLSSELLPSPDWPAHLLATPDGGSVQNLEKKQLAQECSVKIERIKDEEELLNMWHSRVDQEPRPGEEASQVEHKFVLVEVDPCGGTKTSTDRGYECAVCSSSFTVKSDLLEHAATHTDVPSGEEGSGLGVANKGPRERRCRCGQPPTPHTRSAHGHDTRTNTGAICTSMYCEICEKTFAKYSDLIRHQRIHTGEKPYLCTICKHRFTQLSQLNRHLLIHTGEKPHPCNICKKRFRESANLKRHLRIHTGEQPYECKTCHKTFTQSTDLKKHLRIHTGEKPHPCKICDMRFTQSSHLAAHLRIHTGEKPHSCEICKKTFTQASNLKVHLRIHTGEKPSASSVQP